MRLQCQRHLNDLARQGSKAFPYVFVPERVERMLEFFRDYLTLDDTDVNGQPMPFALVRWLVFSFGSLQGWVHKDTGYLRFVEGYFETGKGSTKCLALETPIPTPTGWSTIADLRIGDQVFDESGRPTTVIATSDVKQGHTCYEVEFDDGQVIVADANHLWFTEQRRFSGRGQKLATAGVPRSARGKWRSGIRTTEEIRRTLRNPNGRYQSANHSIPVAGALGTPAASLPVDPYILGVWLGDGDSDAARVTIGEQDAVELVGLLSGAGATVGGRQGACEKAGRYPIRRAGGDDQPVTTKLRGLGVLNAKQVPALYLRSAVEQRLSLLQGLMDTDGHIVPSNGECRFTTTSKPLADGVLELITSLGMKCTAVPGRARLYGREVSDLWTLHFHPPHDVPVFRLARKLQWQRQRHTRRALSRDRRIVDVRPVASVPVKCIAVDAASHLFLAGRAMVPTHNTPAAAGYGVYRLVGENRHAVENYSLGVNGDQANYLYGFAMRMCERSSDLEDLLDVGQYNTAWIDRNSFFRPLTSEGRSLDNKRVFTALIDELHEHPSAVIPEKMRLGIKSQVDGQVVMLTNAGFDKTSVCWTKHEYGIKVLEGTIADEEFFAFICQLDPCEECRSNGATQPNDGCPWCDDWTDERHWPKVNPAVPDIPQLYTYMRGVARQAINQPSTQPRIKRLNFCIWTQGHSVWIPVDKWDACRTVALATKHDGRACAVGFDMSEKSDLTACVLVLRIDDEQGATSDAVELVDSDNGQEIRKTLNINFCVELHTFFWLPRDTLIHRERDEHIPLTLWERLERAEGPGRGLRVTDGPVIDYDLIYDQFRQEIAPPFKPDRVGYDKHNASQFAVQLRDKAKFMVVEVPQGRALSESFKLFEALVRLRRIRHAGNPVMAWCVSNADPKRDRYENLWLEKPSQTKRIDGVIAAVIALNQLVQLPAKRRTFTRKGVGLVFKPGGMVPIIDPTNPATADDALRP